MKRKKDAEMRVVYGGPEFFARKAKERDGREYPDNNLEDAPDTGMNDVYGCPGMFGRPDLEEPEETPYPENALEEEEPKPMQRVYAGPEMPPFRENETPMMAVYAGPEMMSGNYEPIMAPVYAAPEPVDENGDIPMATVYGGPKMNGKTRKLPLMEGVYACPPVTRPPQNDDQGFAPDRRTMMLVYAAPAVQGKPVRPIPNAGTPLRKAEFCPFCGVKTLENANFCHECGAKLPKKPAPDNAPKNTMI